MNSRAVCPRLRAALLSLPGTVMTRLAPSMTTSEPDTPRPLTRALMICCAWLSASRVGREPSGVRAVNVTLVPPRRAMPSFGRAPRRRRRCHGPQFSSRSIRLPRQSVRAAGVLSVVGDSARFGSRICFGDLVALVVILEIRLDAIADRQLHPGGDNAGRDLEVDRVIGDAGDGGLQGA